MTLITRRCLEGVAAVVLLVACGVRSHHPVPCEAIVPSGLMTIDLARLDRTEAVSAVDGAVTGMIRVDDPYRFRWSNGAITVTAYVEARRKEIYLPQTAGTTISDVVRCFGSPSHYVVRRDQGPEMSGYGYILFYPAQGLVVSHMKYGLFAPSAFGENSPVDEVSLVPRGDIDAVLEQQYAGDWLVRMKSDIRKWPTDFTTIGMP